MLTHAGRHTRTRVLTYPASRPQCIAASISACYNRRHITNSIWRNNRQPEATSPPHHSSIRRFTEMSAPKLQNVRASVQNGLATLMYQNPKANALSVQTMKDLISAFSWAQESSEVKVVVLSGDGKFFTTGLDLTNVPAEGPVLPDSSIELLRYDESSPSDHMK